MADGSSAYQQALDEPAFLERVRAAYSGDYDALDAIWWLEHPAERSPGGLPAPSARLRTLQEQVYSVSGDPDARAEAEVELHELDVAIKRERILIVQALAAAAHPSDGAPLLSPTSSPPVDPPDGDGTPAARGGTSSAAPSAPPRGRSLALASAVAIGIIIGVGATQIITSSRAADSPSAAGSSTTPSSGTPSLDIDPASALLERIAGIGEPASFNSTALILLASAGVDGSSLRSVPLSTPQGVAPQNRIYVGKGMENRFCLVGINSDGIVSTSCNDVPAVEAWGLRLAYSTTDFLDDPDTPTPIVITAVLAPTGSIEISRAKIVADGFVVEDAGPSLPILDREPTEQDALPSTVGDYVDVLPGSSRLLWTDGETSAYVTRNSEKMACLVVFGEFEPGGRAGCSTGLPVTLDSGSQEFALVADAAQADQLPGSRPWTMLAENLYTP